MNIPGVVWELRSRESFHFPAVPRQFRGSVPRSPKWLLRIFIFSIDDEAS